jgi:hypothetical protein
MNSLVGSGVLHRVRDLSTHQKLCELFYIGRDSAGEPNPKHSRCRVPAPRSSGSETNWKRRGCVPFFQSPKTFREVSKTRSHHSLDRRWASSSRQSSLAPAQHFAQYARQIDRSFTANKAVDGRHGRQRAFRPARPIHDHRTVETIPNGPKPS